MSYSKANSVVHSQVQQIMSDFHGEIAEKGVTVDVLVYWGRNQLKLHGYGCVATVKINAVKQRVQGMADATIVLDGVRWGLLSEAEQAAVLDHELHHLTLQRSKKTGEVKYDDHSRPKLAMRLHDWQLGGFSTIVERHGKAAIEAQAIQHAAIGWRQINFKWSDDQAGDTEAQQEAKAKGAAKKVRAPNGQPDGTVGHGVGVTNNIVQAAGEAIQEHFDKKGEKVEVSVNGKSVRKPKQKGKVKELYNAEA